MSGAGSHWQGNTKAPSEEHDVSIVTFSELEMPCCVKKDHHLFKLASSKVGLRTSGSDMRPSSNESATLQSCRYYYPFIFHVSYSLIPYLRFRIRLTVVKGGSVVARNGHLFHARAFSLWQKNLKASDTTSTKPRSFKISNNPWKCQLCLALNKQSTLLMSHFASSLHH